MLEGCKWDPQVGDVATLSQFPLIMTQSEWNKLAGFAERLTAEALAAESEIVGRPKLLEALGMPRRMTRVFRGSGELTPAALRVIRFDFHPTRDGWRISEANADVPGGYTEASFFTGLFAQRFPEFHAAGSPARAFADAVTGRIGERASIALMSASGYMEDHQVVAFLAKTLRAAGHQTVLCNPRQIHWIDGIAHLNTRVHRGRVDAIVRFYQTEWLARLPQTIGWPNFFRGGKTSVANPGCAAIVESKRFPLIWDQLSTQLPTWRALLPETHDPREALWASDESWLLKTAFCDTGDTVSIRGLMKKRDWMRAQLSARIFPNRWVAQRRFESVPIETPIGPRHVCVGVYTIDGRCAGAYARMSVQPLISFEAVDAPLLLQPNV
jgi:glutathionylspermidine synthase